MVISVGAQNDPDRQRIVTWARITRSDDEYQWNQYPTRLMTQQASDVMWIEGVSNRVPEMKIFQPNHLMYLALVLHTAHLCGRKGGG